MSSKTIFDPFGFPIIQYKLDFSDEVNRYLIDAAYKVDAVVRKNGDKIKGTNPIGTKYNNNEDSYIGAHTAPLNRCHCFPGFPDEFHGALIQCVLDYAKESGIAIRAGRLGTSFYVERGWSTITKPDDMISGHTHPLHSISSAYYPKWEEDQGGLWFSMRKPTDAIDTYVPDEGLNAQSVIKPETSSLILFPSWVPHGTTPNKTKKDRISYSFDFNGLGMDYKLPPTELVHRHWEQFEIELEEVGVKEVL